MTPGDLLAALRKSAENPAPATNPTNRWAYDFAELPAYQPIRMQTAAARGVGLPSPYYRLARPIGGVDLEINGAGAVSFASYDYLGLNADPRVRTAAAAAAEADGISPSASRLAGGERAYHRGLEYALAGHYRTEDALALVSGHATNVSVLQALLGKGDLVILDALAHNSLVMGAQAAGAARLSMPHNDLDWLDRTLSRSRSKYRHVLIAVEGLYSMDGDCPDLARLVEIKSRHRAWLLVDEAHALGVVGATGQGLAEAAGVATDAVEIWMGTLSKSLAACGGYVAGSAALIDYLKAAAPGFVYSVGLAAPIAAAAKTALEIMHAEPERVARLQGNAAQLQRGLAEAGFDTGLSEGHAVVPVIVRDSLRAVALSAALLEKGVLAIPIIPPGVPEREARLRFFVTAQHSKAQIDQAVDALLSAASEIEH
ncbi:MAG: aminotransferase class I/II-fold pyridoxal phosphate-dependent enzyme [Paracoccaceae bacterium]